MDDQERLDASINRGRIAPSASDVVLWDGFEDAFLNVILCPDGLSRAVYSIYHMVEVLVERDGMTPDDAVEYLQFNVLGAYVGPGTPLHVEWPWPLDLMGRKPDASLQAEQAVPRIIRP